MKYRRRPAASAMIPRKTYKFPSQRKRGPLLRTARQSCADGRCLLSALFFELMQFIVIRFSIDCIGPWGSETRLMESRGDGEAVDAFGISHVINLPFVLVPSLSINGNIVALSLSITEGRRAAVPQIYKKRGHFSIRRSCANMIWRSRFSRCNVYTVECVFEFTIAN